MYDEVLPEWIVFWLTPEVRRKLALWAREEHRTIRADSGRNGTIKPHCCC